MEYLCAPGYTGYPTSETCLWDIPYYGCCKEGRDCSTEVKQLSRDPDTHQNIVMGITWMVFLNWIWLVINLVGSLLFLGASLRSFQQVYPGVLPAPGPIVSRNLARPLFGLCLD